MYDDLDVPNAVQKWNTLRGRGVPELMELAKRIVSYPMSFPAYERKLAEAALAKAVT